MNSKAGYLRIVVSFIIITIGILFVFEISIITVEHIKQDAWAREDPSENPIADLMFTFSSKGGFFANRPIHVRIQIWLTLGENYSSIAICFPDAYSYPRNQTPGKPPEAGWVQISKKDDLLGESDLEFTSPSSFGYIIYSEGQPAYYAAEQQIIQISPYENFEQMKFAAYGVGLTLISIGIALLALPKIIEKTRRTKIKIEYDENDQNCLGFFTYQDFDLHRKHARAYVWNTDKTDAVNVRAILKVEDRSLNIPPVYLHWSETPFNTPEPEPTEIPQGGFRIIDIAFSQPEHGSELTEDLVSQTILGPPESEMRPAPPSGTIPPELMDQLFREREQLRREYSGMYEAKPNGCFIAHNCALLSPMDYCQYYLPPGKYTVKITIIGHNIKKISKSFVLASPESWRDLSLMST